MAAAPSAAITFRRAQPSDVPSLLLLVQSAYRGDASRQGWTHEADLLDGQRIDPDGLIDIINAPGSLILVADADHQMVGCCQLQRHSTDTAYLGMFSVSPELQSQGIGRSIIAEAERIAADELGANEMRMSVIRQRTDLIAWYARLGYQPNGQSLPFPYGDERFGIPKRDDLEFIVLTKALAPTRS